MTTPQWRAKFQTDAQQVKYTTRLTSLFIKRTLLHVWLTIKAVWRFGIIRSLLLLPIMLARMIFFPLQWPLTMLGNGIVDGCRWLTDKPITWIGRAVNAAVTAPFRWFATAVDLTWEWMCDVGNRCRQQYRELRELGFVNAMALMPFLILRLIQGAILTVIAGVVGLLRLCWRGISACGLALWAGLLWIAGFFSLSGSWRWCREFSAALASKAAESPIAEWGRSAFSGFGGFWHSLSLPRLPRWEGWHAVSRSFREQTAWVLVTCAGTLGLLLMLYLQWNSLEAATDGGQPRNPNVAINSPAADEPTNNVPAPIADFQHEPPLWMEFDEPQSEPDLTAETPRQSLPDPFAEEELPAPEVEPETPVAEEPPKKIFNPFTDLRPRKKAEEQPKPELLPAVEEPADPDFNAFSDLTLQKADSPEPFPPTEPKPSEPPPGLEVALNWGRLGPEFDESPDNDFDLEGKSTEPPPVTSPFDQPVDDGWQLFDASTLKSTVQPVADRQRLQRPDLKVPQVEVEQPIELADVSTNAKNLNITITREVPQQAAVGRPVSYRILVHNRGQEPVDRVTVRERLPQGQRVLETTPAAVLREGSLVWQLGLMKPDEEHALQVQMVPSVAGAAENVVTVEPLAAVKSQTAVEQQPLQPAPIDPPPVETGPVETAPVEPAPIEPPPVDPAPFEPAPVERAPAERAPIERTRVQDRDGTLRLHVAAPFRVANGETCTVQFKVTNPSSQRFDDVIVRATLPGEVTHAKGNRLDYHLGSIQPGESRHIQLNTAAIAVGSGKFAFQLLAGQNVVQVSHATIETRESEAKKVKRVGANQSNQPCCLPLR